MDIVVRKATLKDVEQIRLLTRDSFMMYAENAGITALVAPLSESYEEVEKEVRTKEVLVALFNEKIIGSLRIEIKADNTAYLSRVGVSELYQNNDVGRILMNAVDELMEMMGIDCLYIHTASKVFSLVKFYYKKGFYIESTTKDRGYIRALLCKEYKVAKVANLL
ncbi:GNAT family N-acetyltransferase [Clostridium bowmanii]|uniref:GNAT family N-acetyltransferase n=1 Tax=Clostridium bowmanii TaxID=132925 RepID=UPI001C0DFF3A|nr:GNAT family N-acetyltransferase [Clostridium bowmanii]MBU3192034.1 GNAT family N-acetyltransferase [Clostridium bowmanii]MCA1076292.1 GNAT family N-acetyltransferase [Clostridium bowmanii]